MIKALLEIASLSLAMTFSIGFSSSRIKNLAFVAFFDPNSSLAETIRWPNKVLLLRRYKEWHIYALLLNSDIAGQNRLLHSNGRRNYRGR